MVDNPRPQPQPQPLPRLLRLLQARSTERHNQRQPPIVPRPHRRSNSYLSIHTFHRLKLTLRPTLRRKRRLNPIPKPNLSPSFNHKLRCLTSCRTPQLCKARTRAKARTKAKARARTRVKANRRPKARRRVNSRVQRMQRALVLLVLQVLHSNLLLHPGSAAVHGKIPCPMEHSLQSLSLRNPLRPLQVHPPRPPLVVLRLAPPFLVKEPMLPLAQLPLQVLPRFLVLMVLSLPFL